MIVNTRKKLICPVCGFGRLIDSSTSTHSELKVEYEIDSTWKPDYYMKCPQCKKQIAIKKIS